VPVATRRANAAKEMAKLSKKGLKAQPVTISGRQIARTFWGKAWCDHLEAYSDYANRLPRGRTYVRNGSVVDLQIARGRITARVSGSSLYKIDITIKPLPDAKWDHVVSACSGKIDSLIELLQGRLSSSVMQVVTDREKGLFPKPGEIEMECSCPDWAGLCKHLAACLYGIGARLDEKPDLLFLLRGVDPEHLISEAATAGTLAQATDTSGPAIADTDLADIFGIEVAPSVAPAARKLVQKSSKSVAAKPPPGKARPKAPKKKALPRLAQT
jgi:uncharacterized Zn finger protein